MDQYEKKSIEQLLDILACPVSREKLVFDADTEELISVQAGLAYPIRDGIPVLLPNQARKISSEA